MICGCVGGGFPCGCGVGHKQFSMTILHALTPLAVQSDISYWAAAFYAVAPIAGIFYCIARILFLSHLVRFVVKLQMLRRLQRRRPVSVLLLPDTCAALPLK